MKRKEIEEGYMEQSASKMSKSTEVVNSEKEKKYDRQLRCQYSFVYQSFCCYTTKTYFATQ